MSENDFNSSISEQSLGAISDNDIDDLSDKLEVIQKAFEEEKLVTTNKNKFNK